MPVNHHAACALQCDSLRQQYRTSPSCPASQQSQGKTQRRAQTAGANPYPCTQSTGNRTADQIDLLLRTCNQPNARICIPVTNNQGATSKRFMCSVQWSHIGTAADQVVVKCTKSSTHCSNKHPTAVQQQRLYALQQEKYSNSSIRAPTKLHPSSCLHHMCMMLPCNNITTCTPQHANSSTLAHL